MSLRGWKVLGCAMACLAVAAAAVSALEGGCATCVETTSGSCAHMACYYTFHAVCLIEVLGAAAALGLAFVKCKVGRRWLAGVCALAQVLAFVAMYTPVGGLCASPDMACHRSAAIVAVLALVLVVGCVVALALADPARANRPKRGL